MEILTKDHLDCPMASATAMWMCIREIKKAECKEKRKLHKDTQAYKEQK